MRMPLHLSCDGLAFPKPPDVTKRSGRLLATRGTQAFDARIARLKKPTQTLYAYSQAKPHLHYQGCNSAWRLCAGRKNKGRKKTAKHDPGPAPTQ